MKLIDLFEEDEQINEIVKTIEIECSDMLEAYRQSGQVLYRGAENKGLLFSRSRIRQDRRPVEMNKESHDLINKGLASLELPTRGNSLFVSADKRIASAWGSLNVVFIPDGWVGLVYDNLGTDDYSFNILQDATFDILGYHDDEPDEKAASEEDKLEKMKKRILQLKPRKISTVNDLDGVLEKNTTDILINAQNYYKLSLDNKHHARTTKIAKALGISL